MFQSFKDCLFNNKNVYRSQQRFKSYNHDVYTEEVNKIALSSNGDKKLQTFDGITTSIWNKCFYSMWKWNFDDQRIILWKIIIK